MPEHNDIMLDITPQVLLRAYACGIFPMAESADDPTLHWIEPEWRGIIPLNHFHVPRSLKKVIRAGTFEIRVDTAFAAVMQGCAEPAPGREQTWINQRIYTLYCQLHEMGYGHSVECWLDGELVGGLYGLAIGQAFFGESMFSRRANASKVALAHLVARLKFGGYILLDTQFTTDHLERFGAVEIHKEDYAILLENAIQDSADFHHWDGGLTDDDCLQLINQTS